jgi:SAM-dependent methyltransferase
VSEDAAEPGSTDGVDYTHRLTHRAGRWWKRLLPTQAPYRRMLRRLEPGHTLDVGCGIGRNLANLDGRAVGVDTNPTSVVEARRRGFIAYEAGEFPSAPEAVPGSFDTLLFSHVLEHMTGAEAADLVAAYLRYLAADGRVVVIVPQEAGYDSDPTHVEFLDVDDVRAILDTAGIAVADAFSFPFPRRVGRWFRYNETVIVGVPADPGAR